MGWGKKSLAGFLMGVMPAGSLGPAEAAEVAVLGLAAAVERFPSTEHSLPSLLTQPRRDPLFDPTGLREWVRLLAKNKGEIKCINLPDRKHTAAAMDEEKTYAYFHGYTAYRFGYRSDVVTSWSLAKLLFGPEKSDGHTVVPHDYTLLIEDKSLNFADRKGHTKLLKLGEYTDEESGKQGRAYHLSKLDSTNEIEKSGLRLLVTTGQGSVNYSGALAENKRYLTEKKHGRGGVIFKPAGGMFELWDEARLLKSTPGCHRKGDAEGFVWPPRMPRSRSEGREENGHGAPGKMTLIAEALLLRASAIQTSNTTVLENIQGAVLATDALELLGGRTPTLAAEALTQKHLLEIQAECHFSGTEFHLEMKPRLAELEIEAKGIAGAFQKSEQENARLNILMRTENHIVHLLREENLFNEEQFWMAKARHLHNTLWLRKNPEWFVFAPVLRYLEFLLASFPRFVAVLIGWALLLSFLYLWGGKDTQWIPGVQDAISSFFSAGPPVHQGAVPDANSPIYAWTVCVAILLGFVHLGVFISHLYSIIARK